MKIIGIESLGVTDVYWLLQLFAIYDAGTLIAAIILSYLSTLSISAYTKMPKRC
jgi:hypothetical protein